MASAAINLAHEPHFSLGDGEARPAMRELVGPGGSRQVEPKVMQMLIAFHRARGAVLSKDDLVTQCWDGRSVGEDAINRVLAHLRRDLADTGQSAQIETIPRVGYRLVAPIGDQGPLATISPPIDRRAMLALGAGLVTAAAGGWWSLGRVADARPLPPAAEQAMQRGKLQLIESTAESMAAASAAYRDAADAAPDRDEPWGFLALVYAVRAMTSEPTKFADFARRAEAARARALEIDPANGEARAARLVLLPPSMSLAQFETRLGEDERAAPDSPILSKIRAFFESNVGRLANAMAAIDRFETWSGPSPRTTPIRASILADLGRRDQAEQVYDSAIERWPRHYAVWFPRFKYLIYGGKADRALAMLDDRANRPLGVTDANFELCRAQAEACLLPTPANRDKALAMSLDSAKMGSGYAENALLFAAFAGFSDAAFALMEQIMFKTPAVPTLRFDKQQGNYSRSRPPTWLLFEAPLAGLRRDPRMVAIGQRTGLADYWRQSGRGPDIRWDR